MSPSASDVSIVTVNWNGKHHLRELLPSLLQLACREIIVVDNGSSDGSQEFVRRCFPRVRVLQNPTNRGFAHPSNRGAESAEGGWVAFINNDMRAHPGWIEKALARLQEGVPCVASRILDWEGLRIDYNGSSLQYLGYALQKDIGSLVGSVSHDDRVLFPCGGAMLVDRRVFLETGGFDEDYFALFEDVDLGWRLWICGHEVAFAPESLVYHRGHGTLDAQANEKVRYLMHRNALLTVLKNYEEENFRRILPLAIIMALKRAVFFSGVDKDSFYLWTRTREGLKAGDPHVQDRLVDAFNHLVCLEDVLEALPRIMEQRRSIQARRKRSDHELVRLFGDPLRAIVEDPAYLESEIRLLEFFNLDALFDTEPCRERLERELPSRLEQRIHNLKKELKALQWNGAAALAHPPACPTPPARRFIDSWRREGLRAVWRRLASVRK